MAIKTRTTNYLGARAEVTEIGTYRNREIIMHWLDDADPRNGGHKAGTVTSKTISGDGRRADFREIVAEHVLTADDRTLAAMDYADARAEGDMMLIEKARARYFALMAIRPAMVAS